jgi:MFS family permease
VLPWIGRRLDIHGVRSMSLIIAALFGLALLVLGWAESVVWLVVGFFGVRLLGQGALSVAARNAVTIHFRVHLGSAVAISGSIAAILMSIVPFLLAASIESQGWRLTWVLAGVSVWLVVLPLTLLLLPRVASGPAVARPATPGASPWTRGRALRTPIFWMITLVNSATALVLTGFAFHQISVLGEAGLSPEAAAANFVPQTVASVAVLAIVAPLAGRWSSRRLLAAAMVPLALGIASVPFLAEPFVPLVYALGFGGALGAGQVLDGILYPRHFGVHAIGAIRSASFTVFASAAAAGPLVVGFVHDLTGGYAAAALALIAIPVVLAIAALLMPEPPPET